ncbi:MAG: GDP-L-fucose synthase family protein [Burkholderiales bacterium]
MEITSKIYVSGHSGMVGAAIVRALRRTGYANLALRTHAELNLTDVAAVQRFFEKERPDYVFHPAGKVGGIVANNTYPAEFIRDNLLIATNVIHQAWVSGVKRLIYFGSSCIYPRECPQPIREEYLLTGPLEPTNSAYAVSKIAGVEACRSYNAQHDTRFLAVMPTNLYGPGDHYDLRNSHVLPALIRKMHEAKLRGDNEVVVWGSGAPRREFLHVDELAEACLRIICLDEPRFDAVLSAWRYPLINIGCGEDSTITELAQWVAEAVGFQGSLRYDASKPDGTPRKLLDVARVKALGWMPRISLREGIHATYQNALQEKVF